MSGAYKWLYSCEEITDGLVIGDLIVTAGITVIREGQRVLVSADSQ